jgi:uncharacterized protein YbjT (DUF2867 family)
MMMTKQVLVVGGTGLVGQQVARRLQQDGYRVRIFTRDEAAARQIRGDSFEYVQGALTDEARLGQALKGCSGVHLSLPSGHHPQILEEVQHQAAARIARLAAAQGGIHLTYVSGYLVRQEYASIPGERAKLDAEQAIRASDVPYTIFRPTYFTDLLPRFIQGRRASIFGQQPHPIHFLTIGDFARMVSQAHQLPGTQQALFVRGPEPLTFAQAVQQVVAALAPGAQVAHAPFWMMRMMNQLFLKGSLSEILDLMAVTERVGEIGDPAPAEHLLGRATTTVEMWCRQQAARGTLGLTPLSPADTLSV